MLHAAHMTSVKCSEIVLLELYCCIALNCVCIALNQVPFTRNGTQQCNSTQTVLPPLQSVQQPAVGIVSEHKQLCRRIDDNVAQVILGTIHTH